MRINCGTNIVRHLMLPIGFWLLTLAYPCAAKEWHSISPLKTTRTEVLRLLGEPKYGQLESQEYLRLTIRR